MHASAMGRAVTARSALANAAKVKKLKKAATKKGLLEAKLTPQKLQRPGGVGAAEQGLQPPPIPSMGDPRLDGKGGVLRVTLQSASGLVPSNEERDVASWYAVLRLGFKEKRSDKRKNTVDPVWNQNIDFAFKQKTLRELVETSGELRLVIIDLVDWHWDDASSPAVVSLEPLLSQSHITKTDQPLPSGGRFSLIIEWISDSKSVEA